jgi:chorismate mutase
MQRRKSATIFATYLETCIEEPGHCIKCEASFTILVESCAQKLHMKLE